ncbi:MAG: dockerin type I repeat-containing protein [Clostridia bacterium]|nr:dockerin type I repeat-containing protein [Clostridia bacterium]
MKKAFIKVFAALLTFVLMISLALPASAEALPDKHAEFIFNLWSEYSKECEELAGFTPPLPSNGLSYKEISEYSPSTEDESKNFKLILATYYSTKDTFSYRNDFGEYTYYNPNYYRDHGEYLIYLYNKDLVYTIEEAYYNNVDGLEPALRALNGEALLKNGDANGDFEVNVKDATFLQKYTAKLESLDKIYSLELFERSADINRDHKINVKDATLLQKQIAKMVIPTVYDKCPASADSIKYTEADLGYYYDYGNADKLITNTKQLISYINSPSKTYTEDFFAEKALIHIYRTYYTGMVKGFVLGVYRDGDTLYVKYGEDHPPYGFPTTDDIGVFNSVLEIDKNLIEGVKTLSIDKTTYQRSPNDY